MKLASRVQPPLPQTLLVIKADSSSTSKWVLLKYRLQGQQLSRVRLCVTPWTAAHQAPPSMGFSRQEYWRGVPLQYVYQPPKDLVKM